MFDTADKAPIDSSVFSSATLLVFVVESPNSEFLLSFLSMFFKFSIGINPLVVVLYSFIRTKGNNGKYFFSWQVYFPSHFSYQMQAAFHSLYI